MPVQDVVFVSLVKFGDDRQTFLLLKLVILIIPIYDHLNDLDAVIFYFRILFIYFVNVILVLFL